MMTSLSMVASSSSTLTPLPTVMSLAMVTPVNVYSVVAAFPALRFAENFPFPETASVELLSLAKPTSGAETLEVSSILISEVCPLTFSMLIPGQDFSSVPALLGFWMESFELSSMVTVPLR